MSDGFFEHLNEVRIKRLDDQASLAARLRIWLVNHREPGEWAEIGEIEAATGPIDREQLAALVARRVVEQEGDRLRERP